MKGVIGIGTQLSSFKELQNQGTADYLLCAYFRFIYNENTKHDY